jgi:protease IV
MTKFSVRNKGLLPLVLAIFFILSSGLSAQEISNYYEKYDLLNSPASAFQDGLLGFANPAILGTLHAPEARFYWTTDGPQTFSFQNWALYAAGQNFGFAMQEKIFNGQKVTDYSISMGVGQDAFSFGMSYDWAKGDKSSFARERQFKAAAILRPGNRLSIGLTSFWGLETKSREGLFELGFRPLGTPALTLFADALFGEKRDFGDMWSAGAAVRLTPGVSVVGRYFSEESFTVGLALDMGAGSMSAQGHYDGKSNHAFNSYMVRSGGFKNNVFQRAAKNVAYVPLNLQGTVQYQKYMLFDTGTIRLFDLLRDIRAAGDDPRISYLVLNMTGFAVRPEHAWEIREELKLAQSKGKKVIAYFEQVGMTGYHLASVADVIVMEPQGMVIMPGLVMGRTYLKDALAKLGIGFDEWRFFTHKSAYESYSRTSFSDADRQQYEEYIDDWYNLLRDDIGASRSFDESKWENLINNKALFNGKKALKNGLVDQLDRWSNIDEILKKEAGQRLLKMPRRLLWDNAVVPEQWGARPKIALVYGIGVCDMNSGIRARFLEREFLKLRDDNSVKAVVFRVDSPGGSGMASDVVVEALKKCAAEKPVIVSQGQVAGSGGYWISIYGNKILAGPNTITGSIGVIGGWIWDKGISEKLGMTSDHVQRGEHADLMSGVTLPLLGLTIPSRNLSVDERATVEEWIRDHYNDFVAKVADGRGKTKSQADSLAQGRFYSGVQGLENGLVDEIGGLMRALDIAKKDAGIDKDDDFELLQIPQNRGFIDLFSGIPGVKTVQNDPVIRYLQMISENPYAPLDLMPPGSYPSLEK